MWIMRCTCERYFARMSELKEKSIEGEIDATYPFLLFSFYYDDTNCVYIRYDVRIISYSN